MNYEVQLATKDTGEKKTENPKLTITHDWQKIDEITPEIELLIRWGEVKIREIKAKTDLKTEPKR